MTNPIDHIQKLETENLRLQELLKAKEEELQEKVCDSYSAGFKSGIENGQKNIKEQVKDFLMI